MDAQIERVMGHLEKEESPIRKYIYLRDLHDRNETLFHRVLVDYIECAPNPRLETCAIRPLLPDNRSFALFKMHHCGLTPS